MVERLEPGMEAWAGWLSEPRSADAHGGLIITSRTY